MKKTAISLLAAVSLLGGLIGGIDSAAAGEGNTPVVVCHWVPAHGGSYVTIVVDDDGANANRSVQAHQGHANDVIGSSTCDGGGDDID